MIATYTIKLTPESREEMIGTFAAQYKGYRAMMEELHKQGGLGPPENISFRWLVDNKWKELDDNKETTVSDVMDTPDTPDTPPETQLLDSPVEWVTMTVPAIVQANKGGNQLPLACHQMTARGYNVMQICNGEIHNQIATPGMPAGIIPVWVVLGYKEKA